MARNSLNGLDEKLERRDMMNSISFEFFPPKTAEGIKNLQEAAQSLVTFNPAFFSVTFGAGGMSRQGTLETVKMLQSLTSVNIAPHLSCICSTRQEISELLLLYQSLGINQLVALRGDVPVDRESSGEFTFASELVTFIRETSGDHFQIKVAAYPEIHPQAKSVMDDVSNLKRKYEAGANTAITQYFFNPDAYFYFMDECAKQGIFLPIIPGIMPLTQFKKLQHFSTCCGADLPRWIGKRLEALGEDVESVEAFGTEVVYHLCQRLIEGGAPGLHFYTLNRAPACIKLLRLLGSHTQALPQQTSSSAQI